MSRPIGVDLFAGAGGLSLGFEQAGFDVLAAVEIDPIHAAAHSYNFPQCTTIAKSVATLTGGEIRKLAKIGKRKVDVVFGGAPCQGFSLIGQRALDDPRNRLVNDFVRIVHELDANYFVFENVKGITIGKHRQFLDELIAAFEAVGYRVKLPWKVLNAGNFGAPQSRERLILMGCKRKLRLPEYPSPIYRIAGTNAAESKLPAGPSCKDALGDIPDAELFEALRNSDSVKAIYGKPSDYASRLRATGAKANELGHPRKWNRALLTSSARTEHTSISRKRFSKTDEGDVEPISRFFKLPSDGVSNTLRAGTDSARGAFTSPRPVHYAYPRCVTVREMARLHGFPDWFRFHVTKWHGARQIGNAVPPPLAFAVAKQIVAAGGYTPAKPTKSLALGDNALLNLDMRQAAALFSVEVPIGKRDRKGTPKPRQKEEPASGAAAVGLRSNSRHGRNQFVDTLGFKSNRIESG